MNELSVIQVKRDINPEIRLTNLSWLDNLPVQKLLDVISSIIADDYIQIAKHNKDVFSSKKNHEI